MGLSNFCIRRPVFTLVINLILLIMGVRAVQDLPIRQYPRLVLPTVSIVTGFPGADPALVQRQVTMPLEAGIGAAAGIQAMTSTSASAMSTIKVDFAAGTDPVAALNDVRAKVSASQGRLPQGSLAPVINQVSTDGQPVLYLTFADDQLSDMAITDFIQRQIVPRLTTIEGVAQAQLIGDRRMAIRLQLDPVRMAAYGVSVDDVRTALAEQNIETAGGQLRQREQSISVLVDTALTDRAAFAAMALRRGADGFVIRLGDIGQAVIAPDQTLTEFRTRGRSAVAVGLVPQAMANPLEISKAAAAMLPGLRKLAPAGMVIDEAYDASGPIRDSVHEVVKTVFVAVALVLAVILIFLGSLRTSLIPMATIPLALFGTLTFVDLMGFSINIFSLLAMVLAVGLVVDDAIVEVENVQRHVDAGIAPMDAAFLGSKEVGFAVIATTITLAAVFVPMGLAPGVMGQMFREFAYTLAVCILLSGSIARTLAPMLCARLIRPPRRPGHRGWMARRTGAMTAAYRGGIAKLLSHRWIAVLITLAAIVATAMIAGKVPASLSGGDDDASVIIKFTGPPAANLDYLAAWTTRAEAVMARDPDVAGSLMMLGMPMQNEAMAIVTFRPWSQRHRDASRITDAILAGLSDLPGLQASRFTADPLLGGAGGQPVQWILQTAGSYESLAEAADAVVRASGNARTLSHVNVDLRMDTPKLQIAVDRAAAADVGVAAASIATTIQSLLGGQRASRFVSGGDSYNVIIELPQAMAGRTATLEHVHIRGRGGELIPLRSLISITETSGPAMLARTDQMNSAILGADPAPGHSVAEASAELKAIADMVLPPTVRITSSAAGRAMQQDATSMALVMLLAIVFIYLVLSAQFESFRDAAIILAIVPLAMCGAIFGLYVFGGSYNLYSVIGFIALVGLIAKHGILIVEFTNQLRDAGHTLHDALLEASALRLRPIVMTATAALLSALPLLLGSGAGAAGRAQIGIVLAAGVSFGTVVSLFVLPAIYSLLATRVRHRMADIPGFVLQDLPAGQAAE